MRTLVAGLAAAGFVAAGATAASAGTVTRPYTVTISHGGHKTTYRCHTAGVSRGRLGGRGCIPVLRPRVTLDAAHRPASSGGSGISQDNTNWAFRITQPGNPVPDIAVIDDVYRSQGYSIINHSPPNGLIEIELTNYGGAYQGQCVTWNAGISEFDTTSCTWKVSQEFNLVNYDAIDGIANIQNWYNKGCMQAHDDEGEESAITTQPCGYGNTTVWYWGELVGD